MLSDDSNSISPVRLSPAKLSGNPSVLDNFIVPDMLATVGCGGASTGCGCTLRVKMDVPVFPAPSDAVHAIMFVPTAKFVGRWTSP